MTRFAVVALLPEADDPARLDFISREFDSSGEVAAAIDELEARFPKWRALTICHVEDLPLLMQPPPGATAVDPPAD